MRVFNALGDVHCLAHITADIARGVLSLPKGLWRQSTLNGETANALAPATLERHSGGACFNDARVEVARIVGAAFGAADVSRLRAGTPQRSPLSPVARPAAAGAWRWCRTVDLHDVEGHGA